MRCRACNCELTEAAARAKMPICQEYWDICFPCRDTIKGEVYKAAPDAQDLLVDTDAGC